MTAESSQPETEARAVARALALLIAVGTLLRLGLGWRYFGFHGGDDVEILEAGFMRALGLEYVPLVVCNLLVSDLLVAPPLGRGYRRMESFHWGQSREVVLFRE